MFCQKWNEFLQSELGHSLVPNWSREFHNAKLYFERAENEDDFEENFEGEREEWMPLADLCATIQNLLMRIITIIFSTGKVLEQIFRKSKSIVWFLARK